jgi:hypothetical protein
MEGREDPCGLLGRCVELHKRTMRTADVGRAELLAAVLSGFEARVFHFQNHCTVPILGVSFA